MKHLFPASILEDGLLAYIAYALCNFTLFFIYTCAIALALKTVL